MPPADDGALSPEGGLLAGAIRDDELASVLNRLEQTGQLNPSDGIAYEQLAAAATTRAFLGLGDWQSAEAWSEAAIAVNPDSYPGWSSLRRALDGQHKLAEAEAIARLTVQRWPAEVFPEMQLGLLQLQQGHYRAGWAAISRAHQRAEKVHQVPRPPNKPQHVVPLLAFNLGVTPGLSGVQLRTPWTGDRSLNGQTVLVWGRKGLGCGDAIMLARYAPMLAREGARVVLDCGDVGLVPLLRTVPGVAEAATDAYETADFGSNVLHWSLPSVFGTTIDTVPFPNGYLSADPERVARWTATLPEGRKVGLVWAGSPENPMDPMRSTPFSTLAPILAVPGVQFVSLQVGERAQDLQGGPYQGVIDASPMLNDFADMAAAIESVDVVVTADTSVANLAGALGRPVWVMLGPCADYRWGTSGDPLGGSPWYHSARLFRQPTAGDWHSVIQDVADALRATSGVTQATLEATEAATEATLGATEAATQVTLELLP